MMSNFFFFFFKQKTAYEMLRSLVGSEMCIRDSNNMRMMGRGSASTTTTSVGRRLGGPIVPLDAARLVSSHDPSHNHQRWEMDSNSDVPGGHHHTCLLYTSDAADEEDSVDLGGRRIIKKKKKKIITESQDYRTKV
eukprot:TRINITY_DN5731_c0_g1_i14.p1 TRINITY_DN5731_c0_g1~~TRINITY_DN5731_c0_g1_i14.p1  ORF type:complete len:136 (-),score=46.09 TRINITY_DN5731_c0_g1_i14:74-481(-)